MIFFIYIKIHLFGNKRLSVTTKSKTACEDGPQYLFILYVCRECRPRARIVYLRGYDETGFRFHTNYTSLKGQQLVSLNSTLQISLMVQL